MSGRSPSHSPSLLSTDSARAVLDPGIVTALRTGPADPEEHAGDLDLGDVLLDKYRSTGSLIGSWRTAQPRPGPVVWHLTDGLKRMVPLLELVYEAW